MNLPIIEILKVGLPGLVFLLSMLSFRLLSKEQDKKTPSTKILSSIKLFMYVNVGLAVLTLASPFVDSSKRVNDINKVRSLKVGLAEQQNIEAGVAVVCVGAEYQGHYLLVSDEANLVQVYANVPSPCKELGNLRLSKPDLRKLGWDNDTIRTGKHLDVVVAEMGTQFVGVEPAAPQKVARSY
jgi:hypothetical protein